MGVTYNPRIVTDGLVLALDADLEIQSLSWFWNCLD
jgi:hypothetical protein